MGIFGGNQDAVPAVADTTPVNQVETPPAPPVVEKDSPTVALAKWMFDNYSQLEMQSLFHSYQPLLDAFLVEQGFEE